MFSFSTCMVRAFIFRSDYIKENNAMVLQTNRAKGLIIVHNYDQYKCLCYENYLG